MTQPPHEQDVVRRLLVEESLEQLKDQDRLITEKEQEAQELLAPIKQRKVENHFLEEAMRLMRSRLKGV